MIEFSTVLISNNKLIFTKTNKLDIATKSNTRFDNCTSGRSEIQQFTGDVYIKFELHK